MNPIEVFRREATTIVGPTHCIGEPEQLSKLAENTLSVERTLVAAVYPESTAQVAALVQLARQTGVPLYPVSRGRNVGYGDSAPVEDGHVLLSLSRMRAIREYDAQLGQVVIESGVSQQDLFIFLQQRQAPYWMDATGAGLEASIVGNTLEGGFGHTPLGNHREGFTDAEVVLGDGRIIRTGRFPGCGPDLKGLFVQSNFGVVTAMRVWLMPVPEHFESFVIRSERPDGLGPIVDALRTLRMEGVITSCVHIANPVRYLVSSRRCPPEFKDRVVKDVDAKRIMSSMLLPVGYWNAAGGLYGLRKAVCAHKKRIKTVFKNIATVKFFSDKQINTLKKMAVKLKKTRIPTFQRLYASLESFEHIHGLMKGIPTDEAYRNIMWRIDRQEQFGLVWFAPTDDAKGDNAVRIIRIAEDLFDTHGFDMPVTITHVTNDRIVAIFNIVFDKSNPGETNRALALYHELNKKFFENNVGLYRSSILGADSLRLLYPERGAILDVLKSTLDPAGVVSCGRYGISCLGKERSQS